TARERPICPALWGLSVSRRMVDIHGEKRAELIHRFRGPAGRTGIPARSFFLRCDGVVCWTSDAYGHIHGNQITRSRGQRAPEGCTRDRAQTEIGIRTV